MWKKLMVNKLNELNLEVLNARRGKSELNLYVRVVYSGTKLMIIFIQQNFCRDKANYSINTEKIVGST